MVQIMNKVFFSLFGLVFWMNAYCQFPSSESYVLCNEIPKARNVGDTVYVNTCMKSGDPYVLKKIDKKGRYKYKGILGGSSTFLITYDKYNRVQSYSYKYNSGLWGGAGKGFFLIHYYDNGNIKDHIKFNVNMGSSKMCIYDSLSYPEEILSKISYEYFYVYKKGRKFFLSKKQFLYNKELRKEIKNSTLERVEGLIEDFPYKMYRMVPSEK